VLHDRRKRILLWAVHRTISPHRVAPQFKGPFTSGSVDFPAIYIIMKRKVPVLFIEVKPYVHLKGAGTRGEVDEHMRRRVRDLVSRSLPIPRLYGISISFSVDEYRKETRWTLVKYCTYFTSTLSMMIYWSREVQNDSGRRQSHGTRNWELYAVSLLFLYLMLNGTTESHICSWYWYCGSS
jgi:hypothetical protein